MTKGSIYSEITPSELDPIAIIAQKYNNDPSPKKVDLSIGVYKPENGDAKYTFPSVKLAKKDIFENDQGHPYHYMSGWPEFIAGAQETVFGKNDKSNVTSIQTISGTGAVHIGIEFLRELGLTEFYVGNPAWGNYESMIKSCNSNVNFFNHYDNETGKADIDSLFKTIDTMPTDGVLLLQGCCHNPTGADYTNEQWEQIAEKVRSRGVFVMFDLAYQGFGSGDKDKDAYGVRHFHKQNLEFIVCESFSKNMGLYGERLGCLHVVSNDKQNLNNISNLLVNIFRAQCSFAPLFGARIASNIFRDFKQQWDEDVYAVYERLSDLRIKIAEKFKKLGTPGNWDSILKQNGLFWFTDLTPQQIDTLINEYHIYLPYNGRFNVAGFNNANLDYVIESIDEVVRK
ncbi:aspartate aminotransferase, cytoplasmic [[Candida] jaroonii]|uniref:Aspartate aminotransferase, cytoplasmic n=1 Tax=[Candida] jaroonii TaxID=467808 RepID=A0ACA9Y9Y1_9ASCO|nr:aspartate aminotransferase, cytoplasmic [[Candida] jaroonii]